jgi:hypothetical protein
VFSAKTYSLASAAVAALVFGTQPGYSATKDGIILAQQQAEPADAGQASPAQPSAGEDAAPSTAPDAGNAEEGQSPASEGSGDAAGSESGAPAQDTEAPPTPSEGGASPAHDDAAPATTGDDKAASPENGSADVAPVTPKTPATQAEPSAPKASSAQSSTIDASQLQIGAAVFGSDGAKIGEVNGVRSDTAGKVQEILVTAGGAAGINAKVFAVSADKITEVKDGVKLSLTSEEAKQLPIIDNSSG